MRVAKRLARLLTLALIAVPFVLVGGAAHADPKDRTQDQKTASFTFINDSLHETVTCYVSVISYHDPDEASLSSDTTADANHNAKCLADLTVVATFTGEDGQEHRATASSLPGEFFSIRQSTGSQATCMWIIRSTSTTAASIRATAASSCTNPK